MAMTQADLDQFHRFATARLSSSPTELSIDDLVIEWDSLRNREEINAAIREGLADINAGRTRRTAVVTEELRKKHNIPE
jgi:predicted transcriptional regulator